MPPSMNVPAGQGPCPSTATGHRAVMAPPAMPALAQRSNARREPVRVTSRARRSKREPSTGNPPERQRAKLRSHTAEHSQMHVPDVTQFMVIPRRGQIDVGRVCRDEVYRTRGPDLSPAAKDRWLPPRKHPEGRWMACRHSGASSFMGLAVVEPAVFCRWRQRQQASRRRLGSPLLLRAKR